MIFTLAIKSLRNRKFTAALTVLSIALAVVLLLGVERMRQEARASFTATISGTDLLVGARSSPVHLLLATVFHIGNATNNPRWDSYRAIASRPGVAWTIPLSLGDSHRGFRVLGTTAEYFEHLRFARDRRLVLAQGKIFSDEHDAVLGAEVARALTIQTGRRDRNCPRRGRCQFHAPRAAPFPGRRDSGTHRNPGGSYRTHLARRP